MPYLSTVVPGVVTVVRNLSGCFRSFIDLLYHLSFVVLTDDSPLSLCSEQNLCSIF